MPKSAYKRIAQIRNLSKKSKGVKAKRMGRERVQNYAK